MVDTSAPTDLVTCTFTGADSALSAGNADTGQTLTVVNGGTFGIASNRMRKVSTGVSESLVVNSGLQQQVVFQWEYAVLETGVTPNFGMWINNDGTSVAGTLLYYDGTNLRFYRGVGGTALGSNVAYTAVAGDTWKIVRNFDNIKAYVNDVLKCDVNDGTHSFSSGYYYQGFYSGADQTVLRIDNWHIRRLWTAIQLPTI